MMPWRRLAISVIIIIPIIWLLAYGFSRDSHFIPSPLIGKQAQSFTLTLFNGKKLSLEDLRGKVVFLNFWSSWCPPCRAEQRELEAAWKRFKSKNVVFVGINIQDKDKAARAYIREFGVTYPNGRDTSGKISIDYGVWGIPETFFIDAQGRITYKHVGSLGQSLIMAKIGEAQRGSVSTAEGRGEYQSVR
jgi:cytochrome c biogenesis protein CcmG/thiol:disulfide interchange protein DsbE